MRTFLALFMSLAGLLSSTLPVLAQVGPCGAGDVCPSPQICRGAAGSRFCFIPCTSTDAFGASTACSAADTCGTPTGFDREVCVDLTGASGGDFDPSTIDTATTCNTARPCSGAQSCVEGTCRQPMGGTCTTSAQCRPGTTCVGDRISGMTCSGVPDSAAPDEAPAEVPFTPITPNLGVPIPGAESLTAPTRAGGAVVISFFAQYINSVYRYLTAIILVVAIVMVVYGGFLYLVGSAGVGSIQRGKQIITDAIMGMVITLAAYAILNTVNPATTNLSILKLPFINSDALVTAELGIDFSGGEGGDGAAGSPPSTASSEDCTRVAELVRSNQISVRAPNDREGLLSGSAIPRRSCAWCYNGPNRRGEEGNDPCFDDPPEGVNIDPKVCKLLLDLHTAKVSGSVTGNISVACIICGHTRAAQGREDGGVPNDRCETSKRNILSGRTGEGSGQSNHWDGRGIDLAPNASIQQYISETLFPAYGSHVIDDVIGPSFWDHDLVSCGTSETSPRTGSASSPNLCKNGRCGATWDARALCGHRDHIHVGFY